MACILNVISKANHVGKEPRMNIESSAAGLVPVRMASAVVTLDQYDEAWSLALPDPGVPDGVRCYETHVQFDVPFSSAPLVQVGITGFDIDNRDTARLSARVGEITTEGFGLSVETWRGTRVYRVEVSWLALGSA